MATNDRLMINLAESLGKQIELTAKAESLTPDEFVRQAVEREILLRRHKSLQKFGQSQAAALGIAEADLPRLIADSRAETDKREG
jgi:hypothetical protein